MITLGEKLTRLRESKGWTKTFVAEQLNLKALSTYANWEYDARQPDYKMLIKIADLYEISLDELLDRQQSLMNFKKIRLEILQGKISEALLKFEIEKDIQTVSITLEKFLIEELVPLIEISLKQIESDKL